MKIKIYRGTHQIGGCITEITTEKTRIIIDFGTVLPYRNGKMPKENLVIEGVTYGISSPSQGMLSSFVPTDSQIIGQVYKCPN